jgi:hypothetical protein
VWVEKKKNAQTAPRKSQGVGRKKGKQQIRPKNEPKCGSKKEKVTNPPQE